MITLNLPKSLQNDLAFASEAVNRHPLHVLNPGYRWIIWANMGPKEKNSNSCNCIGHRRRALLAIECARRALPLWDKKWPKIINANEALSAALDFVHSQRSAEDCYRIMDNAIVAVEAVVTENFTLSYAGQSAVEALRATLEDEYFKPGIREFDWVDGQLGGDDNDAAATAVIALCNGTALDPHSDSSKRLQFWKWWLWEAVPKAYLEGIPDGIG